MGRLFVVASLLAACGGPRTPPGPPPGPTGPTGEQSSGSAVATPSASDAAISDSTTTTGQAAERPSRADCTAMVDHVITLQAAGASLDPAERSAMHDRLAVFVDECERTLNRADTSCGATAATLEAFEQCGVSGLRKPQ